VEFFQFWISYYNSCSPLPFFPAPHSPLQAHVLASLLFTSYVCLLMYIIIYIVCMLCMLCILRTYVCYVHMTSMFVNLCMFTYRWWFRYCIALSTTSTAVSLVALVFPFNLVSFGTVEVNVILVQVASPCREVGLTRLHAVDEVQYSYSAYEIQLIFN
jgi:hypothetical protein